MKSQILTSLDLLEMVIKHNENNGLPASDYYASKTLRLSPGQVSDVRLGKHTWGDKTVMKMAPLLNLEPAFLLACVQAERAERAQFPDMAAAWTKAAALLSTAAVFALIISNLSFLNFQLCILC
jgi:hypothetical protein